MEERPTPIERDLDTDDGNVEESAAADPDGATGTGTTGVAEVDQVLADVAAVSGAPVAEHVAVFERAHEQLRRALDAQPQPRPDPQQGA